MNCPHSQRASALSASESSAFQVLLDGAAGEV
jgi:hypothetical protein